LRILYSLRARFLNVEGIYLINSTKHIKDLGKIKVGIMGFLKKLVGKKEIILDKPNIHKKIEIDFFEAREWFENEISGFLNIVNNDAQGFVSQIIGLSEKISENLDALDKAESSEEIGYRMRNFAYDNKKSFVNKVRTFNARIIFSDAKDTIGFYDFCSMIISDINKMTRDTAKNIHLAKMLFAQEIKRITLGLNDMVDIACESQKRLSKHKDKLDSIVEIRDKLCEIESLSEMQISEKLMLEQKRRYIEKVQNEKNRASQTLQRLENCEGACKLKQIIEQKKELNDEIIKIRSDVFQEFSPISKVLKKYERIASGLSYDEEQILATYIESPFKAIFIDTEFKTFLKIIENIERLIDSGKIELNGKQKQKVSARLTKLKNTSSFGKFAIDYNRLQEHLITLDKLCESIKINDEIEIARHNLKDIEIKIKSYELDVYRIEKELHVADNNVHVKIGEMETLLSKMFDKVVVVKGF